MSRRILKFDTGKKGFERATYFLWILAAGMALFGVYWIYQFLG
ncbi:MAG: hypothetical protein ACE5HZ_08110 [Fidelibacterota bacterium]